jgi:multiple sugar transport system permease protein
LPRVGTLAQSTSITPRNGVAAEAATARSRWQNVLEERRFLAPALISPAVVFILLLVGGPLVLAIYLSFTNATAGSLSGSWVGLDNFSRLWHDAIFRDAVLNTFIFTVCSQALVLVGAAVLSHQLIKNFRGKWILRLLILLPWAAPVALGTIGWLWIFDSLFGIVNWTLKELHLIGAVCTLFNVSNCGAANPPQWLGTPSLAMFSIILVHAWRILPFATVIFIAGLASIPKEVDDAAAVDGATGLRKLVYVTLPLQLPIAIVALLFGIVFTATDMTVVYLLTNGGPFNSTQMLTTWAFTTGIQSGSLGEGAAVSLHLFPVLAVASVLMLLFARRVQVT